MREDFEYTSELAEKILLNLIKEGNYNNLIELPKIAMRLAILFGEELDRAEEELDKAMEESYKSLNEADKSLYDAE